MAGKPGPDEDRASPDVSAPSRSRYRERPGDSGYFADPDGHLWGVAWNPHRRIADDGSVHLGA